MDLSLLLFNLKQAHSSIETKLVLLHALESIDYFSEENHKNDYMNVKRVINFCISTCLDDQMDDLFRSLLVTSVCGILLENNYANKSRDMFNQFVKFLYDFVHSSANQNNGRYTRAMVCECLKEVEICTPGALKELIVSRETVFPSLLRVERSHALESYCSLYVCILCNVSQSLPRIQPKQEDTFSFILDSLHLFSKWNRKCFLENLHSLVLTGKFSEMNEELFLKKLRSISPVVNCYSHASQVKFLVLKNIIELHDVYADWKFADGNDAHRLSRVLYFAKTERKINTPIVYFFSEVEEVKTIKRWMLQCSFEKEEENLSHVTATLEKCFSMVNTFKEDFVCLMVVTLIECWEEKNEWQRKKYEMCFNLLIKLLILDVNVAIEIICLVLKNELLLSTSFEPLKKKILFQLTEIIVGESISVGKTDWVFHFIDWLYLFEIRFAHRVFLAVLNSNLEWREFLLLRKSFRALLVPRGGDDEYANQESEKELNVLLGGLRHLLEIEQEQTQQEEDNATISMDPIIKDELTLLYFELVAMMTATSSKTSEISKIVSTHQRNVTYSSPARGSFPKVTCAHVHVLGDCFQVALQISSSAASLFAVELGVVEYSQGMYSLGSEYKQVEVAFIQDLHEVTVVGLCFKKTEKFLREFLLQGIHYLNCTLKYTTIFGETYFLKEIMIPIELKKFCAFIPLVNEKEDNKIIALCDNIGVLCLFQTRKDGENSLIEHYLLTEGKQIDKFFIIFPLSAILFVTVTKRKEINDGDGSKIALLRASHSFLLQMVEYI